MSEQVVKRYDISGFGGGMVESADGAWYHMDDYDALHAEAEALKRRLTAEQGNAAYWKEQYEALRNDYRRAIGEKAEMRAELEATRSEVRRLIVQLHAYEGRTEHSDECQAELAALTATPAPEVRQADQRWSSFDEWLAWELDQGDGTMAAASDSETRLARRLWFCLERAPLAEQGERQEEDGPIVLDWASGDGTDANERVDAVIDEIAKMANKSNDGDEWEIAENVARSALATALYNPKLIEDLHARYSPQPGPDVRVLVEALRTVIGLLQHKAKTPLEKEAVRMADEALAAHRQAQQGEQHDT